MAERITPEEFTQSDGVGDWTAEATSAHAVFATGSFAAGVELVNEIGILADDANHHPDVLLTYPTVTVTLSTHEVDGLSERDVDMARRISKAAKVLGITAGG
ncbi:pterin-4-alpha-carbinolamine dehydratase [Paramicrobacterium humi]|uniref:Putative pterin-4-alpha-carbinolamine dehydratase n=1 Tax=Paramicrobacterium humi TaxID=640635 RepID=A0A1H4LAI1_9MICO|nr:4a-hydroxytetrahydrobiopterin dehydratase [Microbacterium humi]SEB67744.1 pterin-4-alpha-carbinolamine dehydratase [Microbacterium humi]